MPDMECLDQLPSSPLVRVRFHICKSVMAPKVEHGSSYVKIFTLIHSMFLYLNTGLTCVWAAQEPEITSIKLSRVVVGFIDHFIIDIERETFA